MRAPFYREDTSPVIITILFPGKEGVKGVHRGTEQGLPWWRSG